jgi:hypothetical protein
MIFFHRRPPLSRDTNISELADGEKVGLRPSFSE